jgi:hypothetical protein
MNNFYDRVKDEINNGEYLLTRSWFLKNPTLKQKVQHALDLGLGKKIYSIHGEFEEHIDELIMKQEALTAYPIL